MARWIVTGYRRIVVMMEVEADSEGEALSAAKRGVYHRVGTGPGPDIDLSKWTARVALQDGRGK